MKSMLRFSTLLPALALLSIGTLRAEDRLTFEWAVTTADSLPYLTTTNDQRSLAYNPATGNLLLVNRAAGLSVVVLDGENGSQVGTLDVTGVSGGFWALNSIAVTEDGVIYAANATNLGGVTDDFKIYRWADESAAPTVAYQGKPLGSARVGDAIAVTGTGNSTRILVTPEPADFTFDFAVLTTTDGLSFSSTTFTVSDDIGSVGPAFVAADRFVTTRQGWDLFEVQFNLGTGTATLAKSFFFTVLNDELGFLAFDASRDLLFARHANQEIWVFQYSTLSQSSTNTPEQIIPFGPSGYTPNANGNATGALVMGENTLYYLETNNGISAYSLEETFDLPLPEGVAWHITPAAARPYITTATGGFQRGMAYNSATGHVLIVNRDGGLSIPILDGETGAEVGFLSTEGITGGNFALNMIQIDADGVIYAANLGVENGPNLKVYRWEDESADPVVIYDDRPSASRWGDALALKGSGAETLLALTGVDFSQGTTNEVLFLSTTDGESFSPTVIPLVGETAGRMGLAFGHDNTLWMKRSGSDLVEYFYDLGATPSLTQGRRLLSSQISPSMGPIGIDVEKDLLVGIDPFQRSAYFYTYSNLAEMFMPIERRVDFPFESPNGNASGSIAFGEDKVYVLSTNQGLMAIELDVEEPPPPPTDPAVVWQAAAGTAPYVSDNNTQRGLTVNPATGNAILVNRNAGLFMQLLDGLTGDPVGQMSVEGVSGGTFPLNLAAADDDGVIYAANLALDGQALKIYRWADESATPSVAYQGEPVPGQRFGDTLAVRGSGNTTQVILTARNGSSAVLFTTADGGLSLTPNVLTLNDNRLGLGLAFGPGNTFWATAVGQPLVEYSFTLNSAAAAELRTIDTEVFDPSVGPIGIDPASDLLVGINTVAHIARLYRLSDIGEVGFNAPFASIEFPTTNTNGNGAGAVAFGNSLVYALDTNNGIMAIDPIEAEPVAPGDLYWTNATALRTGDLTGGEARTIEAGLSRPIGVAIDTSAGVVYWIENIAAGRLMASNLDGTEIRTVASGRDFGQYLAVDPGRDLLAWAQFSPPTNGVWTATLEGEDVTQVTTVPDVSQDVTVAVNPANGQIYWSSAQNNTLYRVNPDGSEFETVIVLDAAGAVYGTAYDWSAGTVYFTNFGTGELKRLDLGTGTRTTLYSGLGQPLGITLSPDGATLYWVERTGGLVRSAPAAGGATPTTLFSGEDSPFGIALNAAPPVGPGQSFANWAASFGVANDPEVDANNDGVTLGFAFALGLDPNDNNSGNIPQPEILNIEGEDFLTLTIPLNPLAEGASILVEVSDDLGGWSSTGSEVVIIDQTEDILVVRDAFPYASQGQRFFRIRVVLN
ncbi:MAG: DUF4623 domain-containing protein [Puniceicoccaceae bacterium]|nr:MAG: DUF4623 domain-containing protein [Puniceicoccaceae bacterium]